MTRASRIASIALVFASTGACSSSSSSSSSTTPSDACAEPGPLTVTVDPSAADVLTCKTRQITATVAGTCGSKAVSWAASGGGSVDSNGLYTAPMQVPTPAQASVVATSQADATKSATSALRLWTALPQPATSPGVAADDSIFHHQIAASGKRAYAVLGAVDKSGAYSYSLKVARSDDGGATWSAPVSATDAPDPHVAIQAPAIAIDAGDPNTVYVSYTLDSGQVAKTSDTAAPMSGQTLALAVSTDGGHTFTNYVLESRVSGFEEYADVTSPAPNTVIVEAPEQENGHIFRTFLDGAKGAGFAHATGYVASGMHDVATALNGAAFTMVKSDGGSAGLESPRLVTDGNKNVCIVFVGGYFSGDGDGKVRVAAQCSKDAGATFGSVMEIDYDTADAEMHHPIAAFGPGGAIALAYWSASSTTGNAIHLALAKNGTSFAAPVKLATYALPASAGLTAQPEYPALAWEGSTLWLSYLVADGSGANRVIVDKSCEGGTTWSGAQLLNGPEPSIQDDYQWPGLVTIDGRPTLFARKGSAGSDDLPYQVIRLVP